MTHLDIGHRPVRRFARAPLTVEFVRFEMMTEGSDGPRTRLPDMHPAQLTDRARALSGCRHGLDLCHKGAMT